MHLSPLYDLRTCQQLVQQSPSGGRRFVDADRQIMPMHATTTPLCVRPATAALNICLPCIRSYWTLFQTL
jgi:hypothetical protein